MIDNVALENVDVTYKKFLNKKSSRSYSKESIYNQSTPYFEIHLDPTIARTLIANGWDVWTYSSTLRIYIHFNFNPSLFIVTKEGKSRINEDTLPILDDVKFENVDIAIQPYKFKDGSATAKKACISSMYVTIKE